MVPNRFTDIHTHIRGRSGELGVNRDDAGDMKLILDRFDIESAVVMPLFGDHYPIGTQAKASNHMIAEFARRDPRMKPRINVYPPDIETSRWQTRYWINEHGLFNMKIWIAFADLSEVRKLVKIMSRYGKPILVYLLRKSVESVATRERLDPYRPAG